MLKCKNINYSVVESKILKNISFTLKAGENLLILGNSGSGKSTLLNIISGLLRPTDGEVIFAGNSLYDKSNAEIDAFRAKNIGIVFQQFHLIKPFSLLENLLIAFKFANLPVDFARVEKVLQSLDLAGREQQKVDSLSVGQVQRLAIARAVLCKPKWILCDEPSSALDDKNCAAMLRLLQEQAKDCGAGLIVATHDARVKKSFAAAKEIKLGAA